MTTRQWTIKLVKEIELGTDVSGGTLIEYECYTDYPPIFELTVQDIGKDIWLAGEYRTVDTTLEDVKDDYYEVRKEGEFRTLYRNEAILHPDEITEERLEQFNYKVQDGRKK